MHHYTNDDADNATFGRSDARITLAHRVRGGAKGLIAVGGIFGGRILLQRKIRGLHSVSSFVQKAVLRHLLIHVRVLEAGSMAAYTVIPNFLTGNENGNPEKNILDRLPSEPYILFVGALLPYKGLWPLLEAYKRLTSPPPLVLIGSMWHSSPREFPPGVTVLQNVPHQSVMTAWEHCLFGVIPSVCAETFGNVVLEAMSKAKPVVGSAVGGIVDLIVDEETGLLVAPGDVGALAQAMQRLVDDADLCSRFGAAGRARAQHFTADDVVPRFEAFYREIIHSS
jgi:glycosyltransferase involved in cell wall biosynthesis